MDTEHQAAILELLDHERQTVVYPGVTRISTVEVTRDITTDGRICEIVYSSCTKPEADRVIAQQIQLARIAPYELEWKLYGHDQPNCLGERLSAAGFDAGEAEAFMVLSASRENLDHFGECNSDIRHMASEQGLADYLMVREEVSGKSCQREIERHRFMLKAHPGNMSVYVGYVDGEPAACGRVYFHEGSRFAGLFGGQTRERFRRRGLFTQLVAVRVREALSRGVSYVCVDALPTSEPILAKHGFKKVTSTQPFSLRTT